MFAFACATDPIEESTIGVGEGSSTFTISLEESRTQLGERNADGKYPLYWSEGDQIAINGAASTALTEGGQAAATFQFNAVLNAPYSVIYPASEGGIVNFLAEQPYTVGTFAPGAAPMYGYAATANEAIKLNHLTGILRLAVKGNGEALTSVVFTSELGKIAGPFTVDCTNGTLVAQDGASNVVTLTFAEPLVLGAEAQYLYVAVPAGSYGSFAITLHTATDKMVVKFDSAAKPIAVGMVREFKEFTYTANDEEVEGSVFEIDSKDALIEFASKVAGGTFAPHTAAAVVANIDMTGVEWTPIEGFNGLTFDGGKSSGFAINGLNAPLFGSTNSTIQNVDLANVNIVSNGRLVLGAVACNLAAEGSLTNCHTSGTITVNNPEATIAEDADLYTTVNYGGLVGISAGKIDGCVNEAKIQVSQLASVNNTTGVKPGIGGVVALVTNGGVVTNCVNGNTEKTTGLINYFENCATKLYAPHIGGVVGYIATATISNSTNYGALDFNAKAGGEYNLDKTSTLMGGVFGGSEYTTHEGNNNYGTLTVSGGDIMNIIAGGFAGYITQPAKCYNNHNKQGGNVTIEASLVFQGLNVAGFVGAIYGKPIENCSNDAPIVAKASTSTEAVPNGEAYYRVAGITTYSGSDGFVLNCENKENGDITVSGDVILLRNNTQACAAVVGGVAYYAKAAGKVDGIINRGDVNVYANFSMHESLTDPTHGKLTIAGSVGYITGAEYNIENYGNITIGKKDVEQTITANGISIGGATAWNLRAYSTATNTGNITIANKVTLASKDTTVDNIDPRTFIGGIIGYSGGGAFSNFNNSGDLTINCTMNAVTHIGGISGYKAASTSTSLTNSGNIEVNGAINNFGHYGGISGWDSSAWTTVTNSGNIIVNGECSKIIRFGGLVGHYKGTGMTDCSNSGDAKLNKRATSAQAVYMAGIAGHTESALTMTNCTNSGLVYQDKAISGTFTNYVGGFVGYKAGEITFDNCTNNMKEGRTYGIDINGKHTADKSGSNPLRIGGFIGVNASGNTITKNNITNNAGIRVTAQYGDSGGLTIGGIIGVVTTNLSFMTGTVKSTGDIYYAGRCPKANFGLGGLFGTPNGDMINATFICTSDIHVVKSEGVSDHIPTSGSKRIVLGGIIGYSTASVANARYYGNIYVEGWYAGAYTTNGAGNVYSLIGGEKLDAISNCQVGGKIVAEKVEDGVDASGEAEIVDIPGAMTTANYLKYVTGAMEWTAADAKSKSIGLITSIDDTTPEYAE